MNLYPQNNFSSPQVNVIPNQADHNLHSQINASQAPSSLDIQRPNPFVNQQQAYMPPNQYGRTAMGQQPLERIFESKLNI